MTMKFIGIAYDPDTCAEGDPLDLFSDLQNTFDNGGIKVAIVESDSLDTMKTMLRDIAPRIYAPDDIPADQPMFAPATSDEPPAVRPIKNESYFRAIVVDIMDDLKNMGFDDPDVADRVDASDCFVYMAKLHDDLAVQMDGAHRVEADEIRASLQWIVVFCKEHAEWFGDGSPDDGAEFEWLANAAKLVGMA